MSPATDAPRLDRAETYTQTAHRIYGDRRATPPSRELLLAVAYALFVAPGEPGRVLSTAARALGRSSGTGRPRFDALVADDAPRYEPPDAAGDWGPGQAPGCEAPRLRPYVYRPRITVNGPKESAVPLRPESPSPVYTAAAGFSPAPVDQRNAQGVCGAASHHKVLEMDPRTGWTTARWFCNRHVEHAERVAEQVREQNAAAPEPIPNTGGLLPVYFKAPWETVYRRYAPARWEPPSYGLSADDWPDPGNPPPPRTPRRLRAV
ncbi:hypothetical protein OHS33_39500 (plasmid) [Streptomyces sp. NBC_00536]|uniref:hypothetical protein n=1 Tax=Streptomyces sp. NBC_00536 TaxID=2975769 RepID=UPI002E815D1E|nr:hypothetical protein [Streptomyces sp. NBC_00536]WUC84542.1 hypothetical protein OHS33_39500 [Streptomyces sp. NBC_00536]